MSISKKVFWIFLYVIMAIFVLQITFYSYQTASKKMHNVLNALLNFNDSVYQVRALQSDISHGAGGAAVHDLRKKVDRLRKNGEVLSVLLKGDPGIDTHLKHLNGDIDNYFNAISEYISISKRRDELYGVLSVYNSRFQKETILKNNAEMHKYNELEDMLKLFLSQGNTQYLKRLKKLITDLDAGSKGQVRGTAHLMLSTLEKIYLVRLNLIEKKGFLVQSSDNFLRITSGISGHIKKRDAQLNKTLNYAAVAIGLFSILLAIIYWVFINKYIKRFLANQSAVMNAIKTRKNIKNIKPFSDDELGRLTQKMCEMAAELQGKDIELRESEQKYRTYISTTPLGVVVADSSMKLVEVNPGASEMFGYSRQELLDLHLNDLWYDPENPDNKEQLSEIQKSGRLSILRKIRRKDNSPVYTNISAIKISEDRYVCFCQDITERIRLEKELKLMNDSLKEQVDKEVDKNLRQDQIIQQQKKLVDMGMMVSAIAHQWRQPLNALALCVQDIMEEYESGELSEKYITDFEANSMKMIAHMSKTIDDFRDFFLPDKNVTDFNVVMEIKDLIRLLSVQIMSRNIAMDFSCTCGGGRMECYISDGEVSCVEDSCLVRGFPGEFKQVVVNLMYNGVDAIDENIRKGLIKRGRLDINVACSANLLRVTVCDNGAGIPDSIMQHIFEPYFTTKPEGKGTGIGLYMSKVIIESHMSGRLFAEQKESGTCMVIELPVSDGSPV